MLYRILILILIASCAKKEVIAPKKQVKNSVTWLFYSRDADLTYTRWHHTEFGLMVQKSKILKSDTFKTEIGYTEIYTANIESATNTYVLIKRGDSIVLSGVVKNFNIN